MRLVNFEGRLGLDVVGRFVDLEQVGEGRLSSDPMAAFGSWELIRRLASEQTVGDAGRLIVPERLGPPVPRPSQVFAIGLNYRDHAEEAGLPIPDEPLVFTKFPSCIAGPQADVPLTSDRVDWEVELVVVIGREARNVPAAKAWEFVAGFCAGQDVSDRAQQFAGKPPSSASANPHRASGRSVPRSFRSTRSPIGTTCDCAVRSTVSSCRTPRRAT